MHSAKTVKKAVIPAAVLALACYAGPAAAGTSSATMPVVLTVTDACAVSAGPMVFAMDSAATRATAQAAVALECSPGAAFEIGLDRGTHAAGQTRRMRNEAGQYVTYEIYRDPARRERWGGSMGGDTVGGRAAKGTQLAFTAYGEVTNTGGHVAPGTYSDMVVVTVNF